MIKTHLFLTPKATLSFSWLATLGFGQIATEHWPTGDTEG